MDILFSHDLRVSIWLHTTAFQDADDLIYFFVGFIDHRELNFELFLFVNSESLFGFVCKYFYLKNAWGVVHKWRLKRGEGLSYIETSLFFLEINLR